MRNAGMLLAIVTLSVLSLAAVSVGAQSLRPTSETYTWSGGIRRVRRRHGNGHGQGSDLRRAGTHRDATIQSGRSDHPDLVGVRYLCRRDFARGSGRREQEVDATIHVPG
jgi:hypothetical protein